MSDPPDGVLIPSRLAGPVWAFLRAATERHRRLNGAAVPPGVQDVLDQLRAVALAEVLAHGTGRGREPCPGADIAASSITTADLAARLGCSPRHARRVAQSAGVEPLGRDTWPADTARTLTRRA